MTATFFKSQLWVNQNTNLEEINTFLVEKNLQVYFYYINQNIKIHKYFLFQIQHTYS